MNILSMIALLLDRRDYFQGFNEQQRNILNSIIKGTATLSLTSVLEEFGNPSLTQGLNDGLEAVVNKAQEYQIRAIKLCKLTPEWELVSTHNLHVITQIAEGARALAGDNNPTFIDILDEYEDWSISDALEKHVMEG